MAFAPISSFGGSSPIDSFSSPNRMSIVVNDSTGGGGNIDFNGLGFNTGSFVDFKTFFGSNFRSIPLLSAFRALSTPDSNLAEAQLVKALLVTSMQVGGTGAAPPIVGYLGTPQTVNGVLTNLCCLTIASSAPGAAAQWRIDIQLRHSIFN